MELTNETLDNAIDVYETTLAVCDNGLLADEDYNPMLDRCTLSFLKELKEYRKMEEQGLLVRLPCKVGDECYVPEATWKRVFKVYAISIGKDKENIWVRCGNGLMYLWNKEIFATKAEAEKALEEMEKKDGKND